MAPWLFDPQMQGFLLPFTSKYGCFLLESPSILLIFADLAPVLALQKSPSIPWVARWRWQAARQIFESEDAECRVGQGLCWLRMAEAQLRSYQFHQGQDAVLARKVLVLVGILSEPVRLGRGLPDQWGISHSQHFISKLVDSAKTRWVVRRNEERRRCLGRWWSCPKVFSFLHQRLLKSLFWRLVHLWS